MRIANKIAVFNTFLTTEKKSPKTKKPKIIFRNIGKWTINNQISDINHLKTKVNGIIPSITTSFFKTLNLHCLKAASAAASSLGSAF